MAECNQPNISQQEITSMDITEYDAMASNPNEVNENLTRHVHPENDMKALFQGIEAGDVAVCERIVSKIDQKLLNKLSKVKHSHYKDVVATPLLAAVLLRKPEIVKLLLSKNIKVDKKGFYRDQNTMYTVTPLLKAIMNSDLKIVQMLLDKGANVQLGVIGPKIAEEEGYYCQYTKMVYPLNVAMSMGICMFRLVFKNADVLMEYGENKHTCLCYGIGYYLSNPDVVDPSFIQFIVQHGGRICTSGGQSPFDNKGETACIYLQNLVWESIKIPYKVQAGPLDSPFTFVCNHHHIHLLDLLSCTDYNHEGFSVRQVITKHSEYLQTKLNCDKSMALSHCCESSKQFFSWICSYTKMPSRLKEISRCAIRSAILGLTPEKCDTLSLPTELRDYVSLRSTQPVVIPDNSPIPFFN